MKKIELQLENEAFGMFVFHEIPDVCPYCGMGIVPIPVYGTYQDQTDPELNRNPVQVVFQCPIAKCRALFITQYKKLSSDKFYIVRDLWKYTKTPEFNEIITKISPQFIVNFPRKNGLQVKEAI